MEISDPNLIKILEEYATANNATVEDIISQILVQGPKMAQEIEDLKTALESNGHTETPAHKSATVFEKPEDLGLDLVRVDPDDIFSTLMKAIIPVNDPYCHIEDLENLHLLSLKYPKIKYFKSLLNFKVARATGMKGRRSDQIVDLFRRGMKEQSVPQPDYMGVFKRH